MPELSIPARPTVYRGIQMRSRLEARVASMLDEWSDIEWTYEPRAYRADEGEYLPDFQIGPADFLEVKPSILEEEVLRKQIEQVFRSGRVLAQAVPGSQLWCLFSDGYLMGPGMGWSYGSWCQWKHLSLTHHTPDRCFKCGSRIVMDTRRALEYKA